MGSHRGLMSRPEYRERVLGVLKQLVGGVEAEELCEEACCRIEESECGRGCGEAGHLDVVYRVTLDTMVEMWQEQQDQRLRVWEVLAESSSELVP